MVTVEFKRSFGEKVTSIFSGFSGKITSMLMDYKGNVRYWVESKIDKNGEIKSDWLDEEELEIADK